MTAEKLDARYMALALQLGQRGLGQVWPNPAVGCVIVKHGRIIGRGRTMPGGRPHAEIGALRQAGPNAAGATVYVTLEPCAHHGQTPPCAKSLIDAKVGRVVIATGDPDPRVNGGGIAMLRDAGVSVTTNVLKDIADRHHVGFFQRILQAKPFITLKIATTIDGRIATKSGESQWITGPNARRVVHAMRARHDAVMVGAGTVRADNPQLTVREMGACRQPVRVVISSDLNLPITSGMFKSTKYAPVWVCHGTGDAAPFQGLGVESLVCKMTNGSVDLPNAMTKLAQKGITRVFCEGGGALAASLLSQGLVDRLEVFQAGKVIGADGIAAVAGMGVNKLVDAAQFQLVETRRIGDDVLSSWDRT